MPFLIFLSISFHNGVSKVSFLGVQYTMRGGGLFPLVSAGGRGERVVLTASRSAGMGSTITLHFGRLYRRHGVDPGTLTIHSNIAPSAICDVLSSSRRDIAIPAIGGLYSNLKVALMSFFGTSVFATVSRRVQWVAR